MAAENQENVTFRLYHRVVSHCNPCSSTPPEDCKFHESYKQNAKLLFSRPTGLILSIVFISGVRVGGLNARLVGSIIYVKAYCYRMLEAFDIHTTS